MVMAQFPNTQFVAHEFVRQYYTMLNKDPTQLHRFYTKESRLTHGVSPNAKSEEPVCGQEAIYEKIAALNFQNCHAKIRSIDSHPTIGGGVVIQVTGELSNSGMGMRKFMQTFVLAQQDPKKYYVFNDIFRYQDETFEDTENGEAADCNGEPIECENGYHDQSLQAETMDEEKQDDIIASNDNKQEPNYSLYDPLEADEPSAGYAEEEEEDLPLAKENTLYENENLYKSEESEVVEDSKDEVTQHENAEYHFDRQEEPFDSVPPANQFEESVEEAEEIKDEKPADDLQKHDEEVSQQHSVKPVLDEPAKTFTWAALTKKNTVPSTPAPQVPKPTVKKSSPVSVKAPPKRKEENNPVKKETMEDSRRRTGPPPDEHQIFIGNLPSGITEDEVREAFKEFGSIVEIRLNPKNFGFVAFTGPEPPVEILKKPKVITIRNQAINTEVKRSVSGANRGGGGFRRGGGGDKDSNRSRNNDFKNNNRIQGGGTGGRPTKNTSFQMKQPRNEENGKTDKNRDFKQSREQKPFRR